MTSSFLYPHSLSHSNLHRKFRILKPSIKTLPLQHATLRFVHQCFHLIASSSSLPSIPFRAPFSVITYQPSSLCMMPSLLSLSLSHNRLHRFHLLFLLTDTPLKRTKATKVMLCRFPLLIPPLYSFLSQQSHSPIYPLSPPNF